MPIRTTVNFKYPPNTQVDTSASNIDIDGTKIDGANVKGVGSDSVTISTDRNNIDASNAKNANLRSLIMSDYKRRATGVREIDFTQDIADKSTVEIDLTTGQKKLTYINRGDSNGLGGGEKTEIDIEDIDFETGKVYIKGDANKAKFDKISTDAYPMPPGGKPLTGKKLKELSDESGTDIDADPETAKQGFLTRMRLWFGDPTVKSNAEFLASAGKIICFLGLALWGIMTLQEFIDRLTSIADDVNNETFKISELKKTSFKFTGSKICAGDKIYNFNGFQNVQKESINSTPEFSTRGGESEIKDDVTFNSVTETETIKPPTDGELTFKVRTTFIRRLLCLAADIVNDVVDTAKNVASGLGRSVFGDINWGLIIIVFVGLIVGGILLTIFLNRSSRSS
jgi:hypothetical protein